MPRTPAPDEPEDDLDDLPATHTPQPLYYAEQALLGALLLEPHRLIDIAGVEPDSFSNYAHGALFAAIRALSAPDPVQHAQDTSWLDAVLTAAREHARGLTASYLHTLIQVCPWPRHASAYARMVETEHARRTLRAHAERLALTATDVTLPHPVPDTLAAADALARAVDDIAARFPSHSGSLPRTPAPAPTAALGDAEEAVDEERLLLATATAHPADVEQMRWLSTNDFTHPLHAGLWQCLTALARRRALVDPVTVLCEAQQRGLLVSGAQPAELLDLLSAPAGSAEYWGERILQRSVLTTAHRVGRRIEAFTDDPATTPYQLILGSRRALAELSAVRARWHHATSPAPTTTPARTRATAPPRAGPPRTTAPPARISR
ncbi:DnaB-like helicase N-terminal domain-containing protein [Streptomyces sp. NBC_00582]|uniref:DnaB-like helicase N-terminal domain-containing protein n=1 Tax=Streptomyces sp. NBC_00582 TaxID=2975783 RepID=UPI002E7FFE16|nr:DnaB-like helicase N-terminal domain-containing protein [Streptomyces sp. NBC_00582]WUB60906.1 replicative DNA helicase [Streptomyces sp. NBC_00582]